MVLPARCQHLRSTPVVVQPAWRGQMELTIYYLVLVAAFVGIVVWAFGRKRKARFEKDARIPFDDPKA